MRVTEVPNSSSSAPLQVGISLATAEQQEEESAELDLC
jgi:hypothetical protein